MDVVSAIKPVFNDVKDLWAIADGMVGWFEYEDGQTYEITIKPADLGSHKGLISPKPETHDPNMPK